MANLKQGTLSFTSAKRTNSISNAKSQRKTPVTEKVKSKREEALVEADDDTKPNELFETSSEESGAAVGITVPIKRIRAGTKARSSLGISKKAPSEPSHSEKKQNAFTGEIGKEPLDVEDKAGRYRKYYNEIRSKMGHMEPIHSVGQNRIHQMLRVFDMSYEFGPCIGMTRLERWERADALGLDPPVEVRDILLTKEGNEKLEYAQCVLYDEI